MTKNPNIIRCEVKLPKWRGPAKYLVASALAIIEKAKVASEKQNKGALIQCTQNHSSRGRSCGMWSPISEITYIQTQWYVEPHGCTGGDYWKDGEGQFVCPRCKYVNRLYNSPEAVALSKYFGGFERVRDRG